MGGCAGAPVSVEHERLASDPMQGRVVIRDGAFKVGGTHVVLLGGNYAYKAQPYFPPADVVSRNAKSMAEQASTTIYVPKPAKDGSPQVVKPCVRLAVLMEGAMPTKEGGIDPGWANHLEATVKAFGDAGVYVFLDIHQDAMCTTNGGEGFPWWVAAEFQRTATCCGSHCCQTCQPYYVTTPQQPMQPCCGLPACIAQRFNIDVKVESGNPDPWRQYAVGADAGNPAAMNVGNRSVRMNNSSDNWGGIVATSQCQNLVTRIYESPFSKTDRALVFDPYVTFVEFLCRVWEKHYNVVAVELFNEPPFGGLPNLAQFLFTTRQLNSFYGAVLERLGAAEPPIAAPIAIDSWSSCVPGASRLSSILSFTGVSTAALHQLQRFAARDQLIQSFHFYSPPTAVSFDELVALAQQEAGRWGPGVPIWLSEYYQPTAQGFADMLAMAIDRGCAAATYWQYADTEYTGQGGWFMYPPAVTKEGQLLDANGNINPAAWAAYEKTVANGSYVGAEITGSGGGQMDVLRLLPKTGMGPMASGVVADTAPKWDPALWFFQRQSSFHRRLERLRS